MKDFSYKMNTTTYFSPENLETVRKDRNLQSKKEQEKYIRFLLDAKKDSLRQSLALGYNSVTVGRSWRPVDEDRKSICDWFAENGLKCEKDVHVYLNNIGMWTFRLKPSVPMRLKTIWNEFWA